MDLHSTEHAIGLKSGNVGLKKESTKGVQEPKIDSTSDALLGCARIRSNLSLQKGLCHGILAQCQDEESSRDNIY
jgi:hypothetical protein